MLNQQTLTLGVAITLDSAFAAATADVERLKTKLALERYDFEPVSLLSQDDRVWKFIAASEQLVDEGFVPGALYVNVDKQDGHVWTTDELERYLMEKQKEARASAN